MTSSWLRVATARRKFPIVLTSEDGHLVIENFKRRAGHHELLNIMVPHGCGALATTELRMKMPDRVGLFAPEQKQGWKTIKGVISCSDYWQRP
jgi:uncharacterized protein YcnI